MRSASPGTTVISTSIQGLPITTAPVYLICESQCAAAHDEGQNDSDGDNCDDRKNDAEDNEHAYPPKFSHCDLLDSLSIVGQGCCSETSIKSQSSTLTTTGLDLGAFTHQSNWSATPGVRG